MTTLPLGQGAYDRQYGRMPEVEMVNRFFEEDPTNQAEGSALLTRPCTAVLTAAGAGPIRKLFSVPGAFGGDLFIVSGEQLFRWDGTTLTPITGTISGTGEPEMAVVTGLDFEHLFIADGLVLSLYRGTSFATGTLTLTPSTPPDIAAQTVQIGTTYYQWAATLTGTPDGSSGDPFQVLVGADDAGSIANLQAAINASGTAGVEYSSTISSPNTQVRASEITATTLTAQALERGTGGNSIATTVTGAQLAWGAATLENGGLNVLNGVELPNGEGVSSVTSLGAFTVAVVANSQRWYFVRPGEVTIASLDFFAAEDEPDEIVAARQVGDVVIFFGQSSVETWYLTGDITADGDAFLPVDGQAYSIGCVPGTIVKIKDFVMFVGTDNIVYRMSGAPTPIRNNSGIFERIRIARTIEREAS